MANLLLTNRCVRSCPYCFASRELSTPASSDYVSWEDLVFVADFLEGSGEHSISLLGGEPTVHPDFVDMVLYLREREFDITVFTSGVLAENKLKDVAEYLRAIPPGPLNFVCNLNDPEQTPAPAREQEKLHHFLTELGPWITPGFNIYRPDFRLEFIFELVGQYGLQRHLRLGLAHPIPGAENSHIKAAWYRQVVEQLCTHREGFEHLRIKPGFDCGFPLCQFKDDELGWLRRLCGEGMSFECGAPIDIGPDMGVYRCFPLSRFHRKSLYEFTSIAEIHDFYAELDGGIRVEMAGIFEECESCIHKQEQTCSGGGVCHLLNELHGKETVRLPEIERGLAQIALP